MNSSSDNTSAITTTTTNESADILILTELESITSLDSEQKALVLILITPEYLVVFAYLLLFW
jgi:hypothetical protein